MGGDVVVVARNRYLEVSWVGKAVGSDGTQLGELEMALVEFEDVAADRTPWEGDAVPDTPGDQADLVGAHKKVAELGGDVKDAVLRDNQHVAVSGVECFVVQHGDARGEDEDCKAGFHDRVAGFGDQVHAMDPVAGVIEIERVPS